MGKSTLNRTQRRRLIIILLAYAHRYLFPLLIVILPLHTGQATILTMGIGFWVKSIYDFLGYKLRWKHIFCSYQDTCRKEMTPDHINWSLMKKSDAYGMSIVSGVCGLLMIVCYLYLIPYT